MKCKVTKKAVKANYNRIISLGYGEAQNLLNFVEPFAYSAGVYGWSCDYYDIDGVLISTGYSPLENKNTGLQYDAIRAYDRHARDIRNSRTLSYEEQKSEIRTLLSNMIEEALKS